MIEAEDVIRIHGLLVEKFGGENGVRDMELLLSAINRPFATFDGKDLYPTAIGKAAALFESLLINHPFFDGNKRTGYVMMRILLLRNSFDLKATANEKYDSTVAVAKGEMRFESIVAWLKNKAVPVE